MSHPADSGTDPAAVRTGTTGKHAGDQSVEEIEADIARTREALAETVDALTDRLDVTSRVKGRVVQTKQDAAQRVSLVRDRATDADGRPTMPVLVAAAVAMAVVVVIVWRRNR